MQKTSLTLFVTKITASEPLEELQREILRSYYFIDSIDVKNLDYPEAAMNQKRKQLFAPALLNYLQEHVLVGNIGFWIVEEDLYGPGMNFIFGQARKGKAAILSIARLRKDYNFLVKEVIHELGHVFGLNHCQLPCVMTYSNSVSEAYLKSSQLCENCKRVLKYFVMNEKL